MQNILLIIHLFIAIFLIVVVLLQRSEGGALGIGGGGGGLVSARGAATALSKVTWGLAAAFVISSLALTILASSQSGERSVVEGVSTAPPEAEPETPTVGGFSLPDLDEPAPDPTQPPAAE